MQSIEAETKNCQNCKEKFIIDASDFAYYEKIGVQTPRFCPSCREQLRQLHRNERSLYKRECALCKKSTLSMYGESKPDIVYCTQCWYSDNWDPFEYGMDYDPSKSFFKQFGKLWASVPKMAIAHARSVNSDYVNMAADNKNCYMVFEVSNNEDSIHCYWIQKSKSCVDCSHTHELEFSYESDDCYESSKLFYCKGCEKCLDSYFLLNCRGVSDSVGCVNLRNKKYCIFNEQYSKEEYEAKLKELKFDTYSGVEKFRKEFEEFAKTQPTKFAEVTNVENCSGNYIRNAKNCKQCFSTYDAQDNKYGVYVWRNAKDCWDCHTVGRDAELIYNSHNNGIGASNSICCAFSWGASFMQYCMYCFDSMNCFGCVGVRKQKYCILNKQYSKEEYEKLKGQIIESLKKEGKYGEFLPPSASRFGYNESAAQIDFPLEKNQAEAKGYKWEEANRGVFGKKTIDWKDVPESISEVGEDITKEIFECSDCEKNYRIIPAELAFCKRFAIPLPRLCPDCRHLRRMKARGGKVLANRRCDCVLEGHDHEKRCSNEFETTHKDKGELVYCEQCYNAEIA